MQLGVFGQTPTQPPPQQKPQPRRKIIVQQYRPSAQEFVTNLDAIPFQSLFLRRVEPAMCEKLRRYVNDQLKLFHEVVLRDSKKMTATLTASRSDRRNESISDVETADVKIITDFVALGNSFLLEINDRCAKLNSTQTIGEVNRGIEAVRANQLRTATTLTLLPQQYEEDMQANYVPVENIIGTN